MTDLHKAIVQFWHQLNLPVYMHGKAPKTASFPFVTVTVQMPDSINETNLTAFLWLKDTGSGVNAARCAYIDKIKKMLPTEGTLVDIGNGHALLTRNQNQFVSYYDDPNDFDVYGTAIYYKIRLYN